MANFRAFELEMGDSALQQVSSSMLHCNYFEG
jgi:hypothetical protein